MEIIIIKLRKNRGERGRIKAGDKRKWVRTEREGAKG